MHKEPSKAKNSKSSGPKVVSRPHPRGTRGTNTSLSEIVKRVEVGRIDPKTVAWARETVVKGGLAGFGADKMAQAKAILERLRRERHYIEDPVDAEFMVSSACSLDGCEGLTFLGEDCDGLTIAFLSAVEAIGIRAALVAHGYGADRQHTHVLAAVLDESRGVWVRCDPSTDDPFGSASKPTRETFYAIPGGKIIADNNGPVDVSRVSAPPMRDSGDFVGVGKPKGLLGDAPATPGLTGLSDAFYQYMTDEIGRITGELADSWYDTKFRHRQHELASEMMKYPLTDDNWTLEQEQYYRDMEKWVPKLLAYGDEVSANKRKVAWDEKDNDILILGQEGEPFISMGNDRRFIVQNTQQATTGVGMHPALVGVIVVVSVAGGYLTVKEVCDVIKRHLDSVDVERNQKYINDTVESLVASGVPREKAIEQATGTQREIAESARKNAEIEVQKERESPFARITKTAESALTTLAIIGIGGVIVYGMFTIADLTKKKRAAT